MKRFLLCLLVCLLPLCALAQEGNYLVSNPESTWVNLREKPTTKSRSLGRYPNGTAVAVFGETENGWYHVSAEGKTGYMLQGMVARVYSLADDTHVVGRAGNGDSIMACNAPNGQRLYFTSIEKEPRIKMEDVNFDGVADIVVFTAMGASNHFCEFFVCDDGQYRMAEHYGAENGLCNYHLLPEKGLVVTQANNGSAGAEHDHGIFRWDGTNLRLIRRAVSRELTETDHQQDRWITTTYYQKLRVTVRDYTGDEYEGRVIWEEIVEMDGTVPDFFERENAALWEGL